MVKGCQLPFNQEGELDKERQTRRSRNTLPVLSRRQGELDFPFSFLDRAFLLEMMSFATYKRKSRHRLSNFEECCFAADNFKLKQSFYAFPFLTSFREKGEALKAPEKSKTIQARFAAQCKTAR